MSNPHELTVKEVEKLGFWDNMGSDRVFSSTVFPSINGHVLESTFLNIRRMSRVNVASKKHINGKFMLQQHNIQIVPHCNPVNISLGELPSGVVVSTHSLAQIPAGSFLCGVSCSPMHVWVFSRPQKPA